MESETPENEATEPAATDEQAAAQYAPEELPEAKSPENAAGADINLDLVLDVPVNLALRVGSTDISIRDLVSLVEGSVVALDQDADTAMDVLVNGTLIAHGEIVVVDDRFGVRLTDVVTPVERIEQLN
jgi:flagellar motor switch protein FliN/FliY